MWREKIYILLFAIILIAGFLRFYKLSEIPVSLYWDEVSSTYNAYSILETGKDEFGYKLPLLFRAFEDYKTPANIYLTVIPVKIFGLNEFSARFTSAFFGTLTVLITFFLTRGILRKKFLDLDKDVVALIASAILAISPWHIQFSRAGFEANTGLFFVVLGAYLIFKYINTKKYLFLFCSMTSYSMSIYFYRSIWIFTPLFLIIFFLIYHKEFFSKANIKKTILATLFFIVLIFPFIPIMDSSQGMVRAGQVSVFNNSNEKVFENVQKMNGNGIFEKIIYNRRIVYVKEISNNYFSHFGPNFLFLNGDNNLRHRVPGTGVLYLWAAIFIIPGLIALRNIERSKAIVLISWLIIAPIPAALSIPSPHALRSLNMIPVPQILLAMGIIMIYSIIGKKFKFIYSAFVLGIVLYFFILYSNFYFKNYASASSADWGDGYKQLANFIFENEKKYDKIIISGHYWQPYAYMLFFKKYDPELFQKTGSKSSFDKYIFGGTSWDKDVTGFELGNQNFEKLSGTKNFLVALSPEEFKTQKENLVVVNEIRNHNNEVVFIIAEPK